jgi:hypothetical protein
MKTGTFVASLLAGMAFSLSAAAQKNLVKLDLHAPIMRTGILTYEAVLGENSSFSFGLLYTDRSEGITNSDYITRFAVTPEFRYYLLSDPAPRGLFVSGNLRYQWMNAEWRDYHNAFYDSGQSWGDEWTPRSKELSTFGIGVNIGVQEIYKERIAIEVFVGPCWNSGDKRAALSDPGDEDPNEQFKPYVGYFLRTGVNVGIAF